jgi:hypothetical protein
MTLQLVILAVEAGTAAGGAAGAASCYWLGDSPDLAVTSLDVY